MIRKKVVSGAFSYSGSTGPDWVMFRRLSQPAMLQAEAFLVAGMQVKSLQETRLAGRADPSATVTHCQIF